MKRLILVLIFTPLILFSQKTDVLKRGSMAYFKGISLGFLVQGQTKYPSPYNGPEVRGLFNDGAYHVLVDAYVSKLIFGFQLTDEYLYLEKIENSGEVWKPRGFNNSFSSLTRSYWISLGYNVYDKFNLKLSVGLRSGPTKSLFLNNKTASEIALGYRYNDPSNIFNKSILSIKKYSEIDFSLSINYIFQIYQNFGIVPEIGYTFNHGGITSGLSIMFINQLYE